jgi:glycosyltransferase involved in cell wall biosynthesis
MHILILPSWYKRKGSPIAGIFFREQAAALARQGHRVDLMYLNNLEERQGLEEYDDDGVRTLYLYYKKKDNKYLNGVLEIKYFMKIFKEVYKNKLPDIVHVHSFMAARFAIVINKVYKIPYVLTEHGSSIYSKKLQDWDKLRRFVLKNGYKNAKALIAVSDGLKEKVEDLTAREVMVIPNMVNDYFFDDLDASEKRKNDKFRFLSVGRLMRDKGFDILIKAFAKALKNNSNMELVICGSGTDEESLRKLCEEYKITDSVEFRGYLPHEKIYDEIRLCDAFILLSRIETFGIVYVEALAMGKPVIMANTCAAHNIVDEENGYIVEIDNIEQGKEAILNMVQNYKSYNSKEIQNSCKRKFSEETICNDIVKVYHSVLKR